MVEDNAIHIGLGIKAPQKQCNDRACPFHGSVKVRGNVFTGTVERSKMPKTATVEWTRYRSIQKYERYERHHTRIKAHNPPCIHAQEGDKVKIIECRPLSKTTHFVIVQKLE